MKDGFVVVCTEDHILYGHGDSVADALRDASEWIEDAVRSQVSDSIIYAKQNGGSVDIDLSFKTFPATAALRQSVIERGGHDKWTMRPDKMLDIQPQIEEAEGDKTQ